MRAEKKTLTLVCNKGTLKRWGNDHACDWRNREWLNVSPNSLPGFAAMDCVIDTRDLSVDQVVDPIMRHKL